jgi:hypothetical protein
MWLRTVGKTGVRLPQNDFPYFRIPLWLPLAFTSRMLVNHLTGPRVRLDGIGEGKGAWGKANDRAVANSTDKAGGWVTATG